MRAVSAIALCALAGCGDNERPPVGPPLAEADSLFVIAHFDDDMIFMQPEILSALQSGSVTTVYVTSGDAVHGDVRAQLTFEAAQRAYASAAGSSDWDCGYLLLGDAPIHHCRLRDRPVSMIGLDLPDGGIEGELADSPLHLVENTVPSLPILGPFGGTATVRSIIDTLETILTATQPVQIHALDLAATHGRDHSSHLMASSFAFWAAARVGYDGAIRWHRGYNVDAEPVTMDDPTFGEVEPMLGYFEACYFGCGPCGRSCPTLDFQHDRWLHRQYSTTRIPVTTGSRLATAETSQCVTATAELADCSAATSVELAADGHLFIGEQCLTAGATVRLEACADVPAQYWVLDSEGGLWSGDVPGAVYDMDFDHVRCLSSNGTTLTAPICGAHVHPHWMLQ
jgi:hypothetical protein